MKRKAYQASEKMYGSALTWMRNIAYGDSMRQLVQQVTSKELSEQGEIDKINAAFAKRERKALKLQQQKEKQNG